MSKTRSLTNAQIERRRAIRGRLETWGAQTANAIRSYFAVHGIFVTVDTVQRDLRAMEAVGTVKQGGRTGRGWGRGRQIVWMPVFEEGRA